MVHDLVFNVFLLCFTAAVSYVAYIVRGYLQAHLSQASYQTLVSVAYRLVDGAEQGMPGESGADKLEKVLQGLAAFANDHGIKVDGLQLRLLAESAVKSLNDPHDFAVPVTQSQIEEMIMGAVLKLTKPAEAGTNDPE